MWVVQECTKCSEHKLIYEFRKDKRKPYGYRRTCKKCCNKISIELNRSKGVKPKKKAIKDPAILKEKRRISNKKYREKNKEKIKQMKKEWRERNKDKVKGYRKNTREKDPLFRVKRSVRRAINKHVKKRGYTKKAKSFKILGCPFDVFKQHIERQFQKGMTWDNYGDWHLDHIIPMASATTEEEVLKLNHYTNFQPLWAEDNLKKSDKIIEPIQMKLRI